MNIRKHLPGQFPRIVCLCGSTRFSEAFKEANLKETIAGNIVLSIGCDTKSDKDLIALGKLTKEAKDKLDDLHKRKIDLADEILVLNVDGYIGESTKSEIEYAQLNNKKIRYLSCCCSSMSLLKQLNVSMYASNPNGPDESMDIKYDITDELSIIKDGCGADENITFTFKYCPFCGKAIK